jgi:O-antigen ligase
MSALSKFSLVKFLQINMRDIFPLFCLILIGLFPSFPPAIQSISVIVFVASALILYLNNIKVNFKEKIRTYFILTGFYFFSLLTYFWTSDIVQFRIEIKSNISLVLISFVSIFLLPKLSENYVKIFLLSLVFGFLVYLIFWYNYIVQGVIIFEKFNYGITDFSDKSGFERFNFLIVEFFEKYKSYSQLGMDGYHYFAPQLYKDFFVHHSYTSAIALLCILICVNYIKSLNYYLKFAFSLLIVVFSFYIFYVDSQVNKFLYVLFVFIFAVRLSYKYWSYSIIILIILLGTLLFVRKNEITSKLNNVIITSENLKDNNQGIDFVRYTLYKEAYFLFKKNKFFGLGLGDYRTELNKNTHISNTQFNSHSQYIYYLLVGGVFNLLLFIMAQFFCLYTLIRSRDVFLLSFCLICIANCLFENFLNRQWGVWIYSIFIILFANRYLYLDNE